MRKRWFGSVAALVLAGAALWLALFPPSGRPVDLDLTVTAKEAQPWNGRQQVAVTVKWHWRGKPVFSVGRWMDGIGFVYDTARWHMLVEGSGIEPGTVPARFGKVKPFRTLLVAPEDGEQTFSFISQNADGLDIRMPEFALDTQFVHLRDPDTGSPFHGWVRSVEKTWPLK